MKLSELVLKIFCLYSIFYQAGVAYEEALSQLDEVDEEGKFDEFDFPMIAPTDWREDRDREIAKRDNLIYDLRAQIDALTVDRDNLLLDLGVLEDRLESELENALKLESIEQQVASLDVKKVPSIVRWALQP